ncbi:uncharacterized protein LOC115690233 [Syzygium oleosum]|uniref:uncharacterized protein LOC115690233 n=1 Tax=Syzygium oleosum TaxID=219896 RepID=UPI0024BA6A40|nr:uncharacterized protein LOC115690233 [Syzygium oleosum]
MDFNQEWKSKFPINTVFKSPLLVADPSALKSQLGPLIFNPKPDSRAELLSSPSLVSPPVIPPLPRLSLSRFISTSSSAPPSASSKIEGLFGPDQTDAASGFAHNRLQFLCCPDTSKVIVFFPTGANSDQVGFLNLSEEDGKFKVNIGEDGDVFRSKKRFCHSIVRIVVNSIPDSGDCLPSNIGYLLAYTMYSVHWFVVRRVGNSGIPVLVSLGSKVFKTCAVVHACWCPELPEWSVVLLESGNLYLFDLECVLHKVGLEHNWKGTRLRVLWDHTASSKSAKWLGCEFSWHPKILIVVRSDAVFLVDFRSEQCIVRCIANIGMSSSYASMEKDRFLAFSRAGSDGFHFALATDKLLLLCDTRKPLNPVLQWSHGLDRPCYIDVFKLSKLRSNSKQDTYEHASKLGFCILLGSLWNCEWNLFCYGPPLPDARGSFPSKVSGICDSFYAWGLPSELSLSGRECGSGSCLLKEEFLKKSPPQWVDWQRKREMVLGFGILGIGLSSPASDDDEYGSFTLIRLMSSGKLEYQRYSASWDFARSCKNDVKLSFVDDGLCSVVEDDYKFPKRFKYLKLDYLYSFLKGNLASVLEAKIEKTSGCPKGKEFFDPACHVALCKMLKASDFQLGSPSTLAFDNIRLPTTIGEIISRKKCAGLSMELLSLAFSSYSESLEVLLDQKKVSLEFLVVPETVQLQPFILREPSFRSNKWSNKVHRSDGLVGPVLPVPFLSTLHRVRDSSSEASVSLSSETELSLQFGEVMQVATKMAMSDSGPEFHDEHAISLADDREETWTASQQEKPFFLYHTGSFKPYVHPVCSRMVSKVVDSKAVSSKSTDATGLEIFDNICPIKMTFNSSQQDFGSKELAIYNILKGQYLKQQESFDPYQDFLSRCKLQKWRSSV